jgi:hypothetical protein
VAGKRDGLNEDALSEIIGFVLILALVVAASTLYLLYVVPAEGREDEITHMNQVQERFVSYKTTVDGLWMRSLADLSTSGTRGVSLSTSFDLGTGGGNTQSSGLFLSFMKPLGTAARMRIDSRSGDSINVLVNDTPIYTNPADPDDHFVPLGSLRYDTDNYYWIQQSYLYEMGGVFLEQRNEGVSVKVAPGLSLSNPGIEGESGRVAKVTLSLVNLTSEEQTIGGTGPLRVETRLRESMQASRKYFNGIENLPLPDNDFDNVTIQIKARDANWAEAWHQILINAENNGQFIETGTENWVKVNGPFPNNNTVELKVFHTLDGAGALSPTHDVLFVLYEPTLQVTFEYDE